MAIHTKPNGEPLSLFLKRISAWNSRDEYDAHRLGKSNVPIEVLQLELMYSTISQAEYQGLYTRIYGKL